MTVAQLVNFTLLENNSTSTTIIFDLQSNKLAQLSVLRIRYLVLDVLITKNIIISAISKTYPGTYSTLNSATPHTNTYTVSAINTTGTVIKFIIITGLSLTAPAGYFDIYSYCSSYDSTSFTLMVASLTVSNIQFSSYNGYAIIYN